MLSTIGGSGTLGAAGVAGAVVIGKATTLAIGLLAGVGLVGIGVIVGAVVVNSIAKTLYDPKAAQKMEETTQKCVEQFKAEVNHTRAKMIDQISLQITEIFEKELASVDGCFTDFRIAVNIDEKKIPALEQKLLETQRLIMEIDTI